MTPTVREAQAEDAPVIADYNARLALESENKRLEHDVVVAGVQALLEQPAKGRYFVAERDEAIVGQLLITYEWSDWRNGLFWWIQSVYVPAESRRSGVFSELYRHVAALASEAPGVCGIRLYVEKENTHAQRTYNALGMSQTGYQVMEIEFER